jgi:hypothetical protein
MSDLQLCKAKPLRKHEVGFIANKNFTSKASLEIDKFLCGEKTSIEAFRR